MRCVLFFYLFTIIFSSRSICAFADTGTSNAEKQIVKSQKDSDIPDFPQEDLERYNMLFNDGFANTVDSMFEDGKEWDIFVDQTTLNEINKQYIAGNDDIITQMDVIKAEKKTNFDGNIIDKNNITTHRTRIMAYLTLDQMLLADIFGSSPDGYYINAIIGD